MALSNISLSNPSGFPFWKFKIPPKVKFFLWKLEHKVLPTKEFLAGRLHNFNLSPLCSWCSIYEESLQHLFMDCDVAKWCWDEVCSSWSVRRDCLEQMEFSLNNLIGIIKEKEVKEAWQSIISATLWSIWLIRNDLVFNNRRASKSGVLNSLQLRL